MLSVLAYLVSSEYIEINETNVELIGSSQGVFAKFIGTFCFPCRDVARDFSIASTLYTDVIFAIINCHFNEALCDRFNITLFPTFKFFPPGNAEGFDYDATYTYPDLIRFIGNLSEFQPKPTPPPRLVELTILNWANFVNTSKCGMVMFSSPNCPDCVHLNPQFSHLSSAFAADGNISTGVIDCGKFGDLCIPSKFKMRPHWEENEPIIMLLVNGTFHNYTGPRFVPSFVQYVNENCGTNRGVDGLLSDSVGTIPAADEIAKEFMNAHEKAPLIEKMKGIHGAEYYVKIMQRFVEKGLDQLKKDAVEMKSSLEYRKLSMPALDVMKKNYNVLVRFLGTHFSPPIPSKQAEVEPTDEGWDETEEIPL
jgi:thiol-disulfide isomerase/thioredoxin